MKIIIDPGHGMSNKVMRAYDPGAVCSGTEEASLALKYGLMLRKKLTDAGHIVSMTRSSASQETPLAVRAGKGIGQELFLSLHFNSVEDVDAHGTEVFYAAEFSNQKLLAGQLSEAISKSLVFKNRGAKEDSKKKAVLKQRTAAVLIEFGFISNQAERLKMVDLQGQEAATDAVVNTIGKWRA